MSSPIVAKWGEATTGKDTGGYGLLLLGPGYPRISDPAGKICFAVSSTGNDIILVSTPTAISLGEWHHLVGQFTGSAIQLYVDGDLVSEQNFGLSIYPTPTPILMGNYNPTFTSFESPLKGIIDEAAIYHRALSSEEIHKHYQNALNGLGYGIVSVDIDLLAGWHMISLPVLSEGLILSDVFPGTVVVYRYERGVGYVRVKPNEELEVGEGYWILLNEKQTYPVTGECIQEYTLSVENGWYMIGGCTHPAQVIPHDCDIGVIYGYAQGIGYQRVTGHLEPGMGYWILIKQATPEATISVTVDSQGSQ